MNDKERRERIARAAERRARVAEAANHYDLEWLLARLCLDDTPDNVRHRLSDAYFMLTDKLSPGYVELPYEQAMALEALGDIVRVLDQTERDDEPMLKVITDGADIVERCEQLLQRAKDAESRASAWSANYSHLYCKVYNRMTPEERQALAKDNECRLHDYLNGMREHKLTPCT